MALLTYHTFCLSVLQRLGCSIRHPKPRCQGAPAPTRLATHGETATHLPEATKQEGTDTWPWEGTQEGRRAGPRRAEL